MKNNTLTESVDKNLLLTNDNLKSWPDTTTFDTSVYNGDEYKDAIKRMKTDYKYLSAPLSLKKNQVIYNEKDEIIYIYSGNGQLLWKKTN